MKRDLRIRGCIVVALVVAAGAGQPAAADESTCAGLATAQFAQTRVQSAQFKAAQTGHSPAYCEITGVVSPNPRSNITVVYRLPEDWNGRMLGLGGGGWAGNIALPTALPALSRGYATAQTNGGHDGGGLDVGWVVNNPEAMTDFSHRAVHLMTTTGKAVVTRYYGKAAQRNYFQGCSTGGRMGMMETQRYPDDYDGVIAGAPVYTLLTQTSTLIRTQIFNAPGAALSAPQVKLVNDAALAACDAQDGLKDGIVTDPRACKWDPVQLQCPAGAAAGESCLSAAQVSALNRAYTTLKTPAGLVGNYGLTRGGELGWARFVPTGPGARDAMTGDLGALRAYIFGDATFEQASFDPVRDQAAVHASPFAREYEATNPQLAPFLKRGGKLILWHGWDDPGPSALATIDYYERAKQVNGADADIRLFLAPGVYHCRGGPGADDFDLLSTLETWVEKGRAPTQMLGKNAQSGISRPVCAYPTQPRYKGKGDAKSADSFECR